jgi:DICT domain-containing protein/signal transduction histidine kinase
MSINISVLDELLTILPNWRPQMYFKSSLTALSHAMEDQVLAGISQPLIIASFQQERFYRQEAHRYRRIAKKSDQVYVLAAPETDFENASDVYETIAFDSQDSLSQEWHLVVIGSQYASCLICREKIGHPLNQNYDAIDNNRRFEGIWTFDRKVSYKAADILLKRILKYRPELEKKIAEGRKLLLSWELKRNQKNLITSESDPFVQRLLNYLQASQYKLMKANRNLASKEQKERLINEVSVAIRRSLDPEEIMQLAVEKIGESLGVCRCIIYRCQEKDVVATINHEFLSPGIKSLKRKKWPLRDNPLFQEILTLREAITIDHTLFDNRTNTGMMEHLVSSCSLVSWVLVPVLYQGKLLGMVELHHCQAVPELWKQEDLTLVEAIATQIGVALIQAESYAHLEDLNDQLAALDKTRSNLVAITGHELRTPLSTIQVCLESLATEPDMPLEMRQIMLTTALTDAERMRELVQDFLTLSQLESGRIEWNIEALSLRECVELAISNVKAHRREQQLPRIGYDISPDLPLVKADGEWLVEVLAKLMDNACKFTNDQGLINIEVNNNGKTALKVTITDTGRGIEPNRLETIFDRFYQEEGSLRRSVGGTGLGLAICRQIVKGWGGQIWANSEGKNQGSQFHFTIPIFRD